MGGKGNLPPLPLNVWRKFVCVDVSTIGIPDYFEEVGEKSVIFFCLFSHALFIPPFLIDKKKKKKIPTKTWGRGVAPLCCLHTSSHIFPPFFFLLFLHKKKKMENGALNR